MQRYVWTMVVVMGVGPIGGAAAAGKKSALSRWAYKAVRGWQAYKQAKRTARNLALQRLQRSGWSVRVCASGGAGGVNGKACVGTGGVSWGTSAGTGVSAGASSSVNWGGRRSTCTTVSGSGGKGAYGTGSGSVCRTNRGRTYTEVGGGGGVGAGTEGWKGAVTVEVHKRSSGRR